MKTSYKIWLKHIVFFFDNAKENNSSQAELLLIFLKTPCSFCTMCFTYEIVWYNKKRFTLNLLNINFVRAQNLFFSLLNFEFKKY